MKQWTRSGRDQSRDPRFVCPIWEMSASGSVVSFGAEVRSGSEMVTLHSECFLRLLKWAIANYRKQPDPAVPTMLPQRGAPTRG